MGPLTTMKRLREERGWTRCELARRAGMHPADVGRLEAGKAYLWPAWRRKLAAAFGMNERDLFPEVADDGESTAPSRP